jgi:ribose 5-phosphate isomerase B
MLQVVVAGDAYGYSLYKMALEHLSENHPQVEVVDSGHWPRFSQAGYAVGRLVEAAAAAQPGGQTVRGIVCCGSGMGSCIVANKFPRVRAACASAAEEARTARSLFDCNVLTLSGRATSSDAAKK